jgi:phenylacetate-CoA ligase
MRVSAFVRIAAQHPFYREWLGDHRVRVQQIDSLSSLSHLPLLRKEVVKDAQKRGLFGKATILTTTAHTSGTTGAGFVFPVTASAQREQWAVWWRYRGWHGIRRGTWCAYFGGRSIVPSAQVEPPFWRVNLPSRQVLFSAYHISPATVSHYVQELNRQRLPWLHGYPSILSTIAGWLVSRGQTLDYPVQWVTVGAENLMAHQADLIEKAFGVRPRQHYGMAEGVANISECPQGSLHVDEDYAGVEFVNNENGVYCVVGTNFTNEAMPLLRYVVDDVVTMSNVTCSCGRGGRVVVDVDGRKEDYIRLPNGSVVGRLDHIFKDMTNVTSAQIVQSRPDSVLVKVVRGPRFTDDDETRIRSEFVLRMGGTLTICVEYVDNIPREANGKFRFVKSELPQHLNN